MKPLTKQQGKTDSNQLASPKNASTRNRDTIRVFFALWPEPAIQSKLHALAKTFQAQCSARVMRNDTLHMTLQFIGNIKRSQLSQLIKAADCISGITPFTLELNTLAFWKHNRIGYATLKTGVPGLEGLVAALQLHLANENVRLDSSRFSPHVTLLRNIEHMLPAQDFTTITWPVRSFVLVESVTTQLKTEYKILREWPLRGITPDAP